MESVIWRLEKKVMEKEAKQERPSDDSVQPVQVTKARRWFKRGLISLSVVMLAVLLLAWLYLPRIAERLIRDAMAESGLQRYEFQVKRVGLGGAVLEKLLVADGDWKISAERVLVKYAARELAEGKIEHLVIEGMQMHVDLPDVVGTKQDIKAVWIHDLPSLMERIGEIRAEGAKLTIGRRGNSAVRRIDLVMDRAGNDRLAIQARADDFNLGMELKEDNRRAELSLRVDELRPIPFLAMLKVALALDESLLPEGLSIGEVNMVGGLVVEEGVLSPLELEGTMSDLVYGRGQSSPRLQAGEAKTKLLFDAAGAGVLDMEGQLDELSLPVDAFTGLDLRQAEQGRALWHLTGTWGAGSVQLKGSVERLNLTGQYQDKPVELVDASFEFQQEAGVLKAAGNLWNGGVKVPLRYRHKMRPAGEGWMLVGKAQLEPFVHDHTLPALRALIGFFDGVEVAGMSSLDFDFSVGSDELLSGMVIASLEQGQVNVAHGKLKASDVSGTHQLHIRPNKKDSEDASGTKSGNFHTVDLSLARLEMTTTDALGFDLVHDAQTPVTMRAKGSLDSEGRLLDGTISGLELYGEKNGNALHLSNISLIFELDHDGGFTAGGSMNVEGNDIPFSYRHQRELKNGGWLLHGSAEIKDADLEQPVHDVVILVDAMEGKSVSGHVSMKLDFSVGSERDFDGELQAAIRNGMLVFADDGPVVEGVTAELKLDSLVQKTTREFQRVTATKMTAFDLSMSDLGLDFQLLPGGDIKLRNIGLMALGGQITIDDFVLPGDAADYTFKVRAKKLDVAQLADLFPDFSGSISGSIDGLLPLEVKNGEVIPGRGGMYLTPRTRGKLVYDAGNSFSAGLHPKSEEYKRMKMVEDSLRELELKVLSVRLFDPRDQDKAVVLRLEGQAPHIEGSPPIHLNINGFKPDDETMDFFDLLLRQREKIDFGF